MFRGSASGSGRFAVALLLAVALSVWLIRPAVLVIALALVYACITWPLTKAVAVRLPWPVAVAVVNGGIAAVCAFGVLAAGPAVYGQLHALAAEMPAAFGAAAAVVQAQAVNGNVMLWSRELLQAGLGVARSAAGVAGAAILIPFLAAYLQLDQPRYARAVERFVEPQRREALRRLAGELAHVVGTFFRAQLIVSAIVGLMVYGVLSVTGTPFAPAIALLTGAADLIPYLGGIAAFVPSIVLALALGGPMKAAFVGVLLIAVFEIEAQILQPQIVGARMHLPPSAVVIALLVGGSLFGIAGLYLAVPIAATIPALMRFAGSPGFAAAEAAQR